jgi:DNA-directed RNA polymerase specialized sigma24 family protein
MRWRGVEDSMPPDADARLRWIDLSSAMSRLTPLQRSALILTAVVGLGTDVVAEALQTTPGGVRAAVSRARATLREADA